ncbi:MAG TPA: tRNA (guanosine(37)-N1)-methyltransferase TrmD [Planctomycetota bacterium]|nr:tRNA (guanosine(37)-N1)-methyltransferase TrmD [Planctomycetota bacterium]
MPLSFDILTIFPDMFTGVLGESIVARALASGLLRVQLTNIRDFTTDRHRKVDDRPYGGGPGMIFKPEPVLAAVESVLARHGVTGGAEAGPSRLRKVLLTPQGKRLTQADLRGLASAAGIVLLCGHYEGFDERVVEWLAAQHGFEEISVGDYILSGGEIPAMVILEGVVRLLPGALGHPLSAREESFEDGTLEFPQYTRPPEFRGMRVPDVLLSGNHQLIEQWRREESLKRTRERRRDLLAPSPGAGSDAPGAGREGREARRQRVEYGGRVGGRIDGAMEGSSSWT